MLDSNKHMKNKREKKEEGSVIKYYLTFRVQGIH